MKYLAASSRLVASPDTPGEMNCTNAEHSSVSSPRKPRCAALAVALSRCALLAVALARPSQALAQAAIVGTVLDPTSAAIPDARIVATQIATAAVRETHTDTAGRFQLSNLPIGIYTVRCERTGFQTTELQQVSLSIHETLEEPITLKIASASETVGVLEQPQSLQTTAVTTSVALGGERIDDTPTQRRNYLNFVLLAPGVAPARTIQHAALDSRSAQPG